MIEENYVRYIIDNYMKMLLRVSFSYVKNSQDAEDIVQEVFVRLIKQDKEFEDKEHEKAWLVRVTINLSLDYLKAARRKDVPLEEGWNGEIIKENDILSEILALPPKYKAPIYLYYVEGYSVKEIGLILKKKSATIGTLLHRGRKMLRLSIEEG